MKRVGLHLLILFVDISLFASLHHVLLLPLSNRSVLPCFWTTNMRFAIELLLFCIFTVEIWAGAPAIHLPIYRRGGRFVHHELANITSLATVVSQIEKRYASTYTDLDGNRIVRRWHDGPLYEDRYMLDRAGTEGVW